MPRRSRRSCLRCLHLVVFSLLSFPLLAQTPVAGDPAPQPPAKETESAPLPRYGADSAIKLAAGDLVQVSVFGVPDLSTKARVSSSGDLYLPLIDYVHIADLTVDEAQGLIEKRLADGGFVRNPHATIFVDESTSQAINVMGEVARPGPYPAVGDRHLYDLISAAGGLTDRASRNVTIVHRNNPEQKVELHLAYNLAEAPQDNVEIRPGDMIIVQRAGIVYVIGNVARPSGFIIEDSALTVLKVFALAGGGTRTASLNGAKILRQTPTGIQEIPVPLKKMLQVKAADVQMVRGDILFVPGSAMKTVAFRTADAAAAMTSTLAVVAIRP